MVIYGVGLLAICTLFGIVIGDVLGVLIGVKANVGGVGFGMLLLLFLTEHLKKSGRFPAPSAQGIGFWTAMYIPVVVAMAAQQNVLGAVKGGPMAIVAGVAATVVCFALIPMIDRIGVSKQAYDDQTANAKLPGVPS